MEKNHEKSCFNPNCGAFAIKTWGTPGTPQLSSKHYFILVPRQEMFQAQHMKMQLASPVCVSFKVVPPPPRPRNLDKRAQAMDPMPEPEPEGTWILKQNKNTRVAVDWHNVMEVNEVQGAKSLSWCKK